MYNHTEHNLLSQILDQIEMESGKFKGRSSRDFVTRLSANFQAIRALFMDLYGRQMDHEKRFRQLIVALYDNFQQRPKNLRLRDKVREINPQWLLSQEWVGMTLYTRHFNRDLPGFLKRIDYLEELGVNLVHLMPVLKSPKEDNDGGYAVSDYGKIDPDLGKMSDIRAIAKKFRKKDMLLTLDLVLNHTSCHHQWAKKALKGNKKYQDYYYMFDDRLIPDRFEADMPEVFPVSAPGNFTYQKELKKWVMTVFHEYQWDLNYRNPQVFIEMTKVLLNLANQGVDIFRLDAPAFLWKEIGTSCQNLEQAHTILKLMKRCVEVVAPGVKFIAEAIVAPAEIVKYFGDHEKGPECDVAYNATLMALIWDALATTKVNLIHKSMEKLPMKPLGATWINYVRCHDDIGLGFDDEDIYRAGFDAKLHRAFLLDYYTGKFQGSKATGGLFMLNPSNGDARISGTLASLAGLEKSLKLAEPDSIENAIRKIVLVHSIILSFGGLPMIYSGDEIGQCNDYGFQKDPDREYDNRWMHRPYMDWKSAAKRKKEDSLQHKIFTSLQALILIRKNSPEWADYNNCKFIDCENQHILGYLRYSGANRGKSPRTQQTLVMVNFHPAVQFVEKKLLLQQGFDLKSGIIDRYTEKPPQFRRDLLEIQPYQVCFITNNT